jgi:hypothetical protein
MIWNPAIPIGGAVPNGTAQSVLFVNLTGVLAQDNAHFFYNPAVPILTDKLFQVGDVANPFFAGPNYQMAFGRNITNPIQVTPSYGYTFIECSPMVAQNITATDGLYQDYVVGGEFAPIVSGSGGFAGVQGNNLAPVYAGSGTLYDGLYGFTGTPQMTGSGTVDILCGAYMRALQTAGTLRQAAGIIMDAHSRDGGTRSDDIGILIRGMTNGQVNNRALQITQSAAVPGSYTLFLDGTAPSYHNGNLGIGKLPTTTSPVCVSGLPTSAAGLATGDLWVDTTGALNVLKVK